ncbi:MAG: AraC family transcriptional regulator [Reinekea sp.]|nr:AraC family transcriptional regulator [Reinekea sp.]
MEIYQYRPEGLLRNWVHCIIFYRGYSSECPVERVLPGNYSQLVIPLDDQVRRVRRHQQLGACEFRQGWLMGIQTHPVDYESEQNATTVVVQFNALALSPLCQLASHELTNQMIALESLGTTFVQLRERLCRLSEAKDILLLLESSLTQLLAQSSPDDRVARYLQAGRMSDCLSLRDISEAMGFSHKHFIDKFKQATGITPKLYQRLMRLNQALLGGGGGEGPRGLTDFGDFFDQSHAIHEIKSFTGLTPRQLQQSRRPYPNVIELFHDSPELSEAK